MSLLADCTHVGSIKGFLSGGEFVIDGGTIPTFKREVGLLLCCGRYFGSCAVHETADIVSSAAPRGLGAESLQADWFDEAQGMKPTEADRRLFEDFLATVDALERETKNPKKSEKRIATLRAKSRKIVELLRCKFCQSKAGGENR